MQGMTPEEIADYMITNEQQLRDYLRHTSFVGGRDNALSAMLSGLDIVYRVKPEKERSKFKKVFFTRPMLNLSYENLLTSRKLATLLNKNENSIERYIRILLDPRQEYGAKNFPMHRSSIANPEKGEPIRSLLIDKYQPFMPPLTNGLLKASGYPDTVLDTYTTKPGIRKEVVGWTDSINRIFTAWDLDLTFYNSKEEPIFKIFDIWTEYQSLASEGVIMPWFDFLLGRRIDYVSGIFTFVLDADMRTINHYSKTIGHPVVNPNGKFYDVDIDSNVAEELHDINMRFRCYGAEYEDPMILVDFNRYVASFNPKLRNFLGADGYKESNDYVELPAYLYPIFNNFAIPYVDLIYKKLEWLVSKEDMKIIEKKIKESK